MIDSRSVAGNLYYEKLNVKSYTEFTQDDDSGMRENPGNHRRWKQYYGWRFLGNFLMFLRWVSIGKYRNWLEFTGNIRKFSGYSWCFPVVPSLTSSMWVVNQMIKHVEIKNNNPISLVSIKHTYKIVLLIQLEYRIACYSFAPILVMPTDCRITIHLSWFSWFDYLKFLLQLYFANYGSST